MTEEQEKGPELSSCPGGYQVSLDPTPVDALTSHRLCFGRSLVFLCLPEFREPDRREPLPQTTR